MPGSPDRPFDVAVAGAGPAGSVGAYLLAKSGCRVALLEASDFSTDRFGGTLPPEVRPVLEQLQLWDVFQAARPLPAPGMVSAWGHATPIEHSFVGSPHGPGWHACRMRLDAALFQTAATAGVSTFQRTRINNCEPPVGLSTPFWQLHTTNPSLPTVRARFLVDAAGAAGIRSPLPRHAIYDDPLLAAVTWHDYPGDSMPADRRTVIEAVPSGWWYWAPLPAPNRAWSMFFTDRAEHSEHGIDLAQTLEHAPLLRARRTNSRILRSRLFPVRSQCQTQMSGRSWLLAGDRAATFDPVSGMGIFQAWAHAGAAARAVLDALEGAAEPAATYYRNQVTASWQQYRADRWSQYRMESRWPQAPFWKRLHNGSQASERRA